jgi:hypothetical protein
MFTTDIKTDLASDSHDLFMPDNEYNSMYENSKHMCNIRNAHLYRYLLSQLLQNMKFDTEFFINGRREFSQFTLTDLSVNIKASENCLSPDDIHTLNRYTKLSAACVPLIYLNVYIFKFITSTWVLHIVASHFQRRDHTLHIPVRQTIKALSFCEVPHTEYFVKSGLEYWYLGLVYPVYLGSIHTRFSLT